MKTLARPRWAFATVLVALAWGCGPDAGSLVHLHVARDDARMEQIAECLTFFAPQVTVETFPAWDWSGHFN